MILSSKTTKADVPLAQLAATDRLIDQVVYRLYGLTEAEIALVAGRPPNDHAVWYTHGG